MCTAVSNSVVDRCVFYKRAHLLPFLEEVFTRLQDLLVLNAPAGSNANGVPHLLSDEDQLFVYETASTLIISSTLPPEVDTVILSLLDNTFLLNFDTYVL